MTAERLQRRSNSEGNRPSNHHLRKQIPAASVLRPTRARAMLRRKPTRIELKPDDIEEFDQYMKEKAAMAAREKGAGGASAGEARPLAPKPPTVAERIGLNK